MKNYTLEDLIDLDLEGFQEAENDEAMEEFVQIFEEAVAHGTDQQNP